MTGFWWTCCASPPYIFLLGLWTNGQAQGPALHFELFSHPQFFPELLNRSADNVVASMLLRIVLGAGDSWLAEGGGHKLKRKP